MTQLQTTAGLWHHELRTRKEAGPHVGHLARELGGGGGGHPDAAGFVHEMMLPVLPEMRTERRLERSRWATNCS